MERGRRHSTLASGNSIAKGARRRIWKVVLKSEISKHLEFVMQRQEMILKRLVVPY